MKHDASMNIIMLDSYLTVGGVATYLKALSKGMMERNHTVWLMTAADDGNRKIIKDFTSYGIRVVTIPNSRNRLITVWRFIKNLFQFLKENSIDVIHSHHRLVNLAGIIVSKMIDVPHLLTLHVFKDDHKLLLKRWKNEWLTVPSHALKNHLVRHYGFKEDHVEVIHNVIKADFDVDEKQKASIKKKMFDDSGKFYVSYVGRISHAKGVDILVESIPLVKEHHPEVEFRIFGTGDELPKLKRRCRKLGLESGRIFRGTTHYVNEILSLTDLCVIPSRSESFCLFALECMRAGKPVIASRAGGIPEVIIDGETGLLVEPEDPEALARSIIKIYENRNLGQLLGRNGYQRFKEAFPLEQFYNAYESKYQYLTSVVSKTFFK